MCASVFWALRLHNTVAPFLAHKAHRPIIILFMSN